MRATASSCAGLFYRRQIWDKLKQKAVFGEPRHATDKLAITAGLRWYDYDKTVTGITDIRGT